MSVEHENKRSKTAGYYQILGTLLCNGTMPISKIGRVLCISKPNMTSFIDSLVSEGHVERSPHESDRRITNISITPEGEKFLKDSRKSVEKIIEKNLSTLSETEYRELKVSLESIKKMVMKIDCG